MVMNPADSTLFNLNETATAIWLAADGKKSLRQIVERDICPAWTSIRNRRSTDAEQFARELAAHSILLTSIRDTAPEKS